MNNNSNKPGEFDALLGGEAPPPVSGVVLGGIQGVKSRLKSSVIEVKLAAISEALNYGDMGLDLVINTLTDSSERVQHFAARLLKKRGGDKGKQALLSFAPWLYFTQLEDWTKEYFNPDVGINHPEGKVYVVNLELLKILLQDSYTSKIEALSREIRGCNYNYVPRGSYSIGDNFDDYIKILLDADDKLANLKYLFIGNAEARPFMSSYLELGDVTPVLRNFPKLEVLQVRGGWCSPIRPKPLRHKYLKTLIFETGLIFINSDTVDQICQLDLPALEYLELWLGGCHRTNSDSGTMHLLPIMSGELFPNLKYLGLRSSDYSDNIAICLTELPTIIDRLAILDLSMGTLTDEGAKALLNFPSINQLHTLDVSMNYLSTNMIEELSQLDCQVITNPQANDENEESEFGDRYTCLYE
ncbi:MULTISPECIES: HEAT repeat domain-containing protein [unclassified Nostoc]|uniref:HEAT repeat domain-containing protein n=1 Tax=unclassified Nostoc TaxID=2593658 RepID=UPI002AD3EEA4|nr:HEAT repeat domain-containing protein [Nostoc sp. DedQUE03]MDZ7977468.1 HEAT repeat domain-containing protein [Nostoc sp. DedQUE03]MDZ8047347.1 HEAT repeat domain-containing protein [Nostoc sp. DedQUE02]